MLPDYHHSLLSLISSILHYYGVPTPHRTLPEADIPLSAHPRNVVVMLFDGMGADVLQQHLPPNAFLRQHMSATISSVFPPTTTAATITMETGLSPAEHGWLGWNLYFDEIGDIVNLFPNTLADGNGKKAAEYHVARTLLPYQTVFERIQAADPTIHTHYVSPYTDYHAKTVSAVCEAVRTICRDAGQHYIYAYHPQPDYDMHDLGCSDVHIAKHLIEINAAVEELITQCPDTLFFITADHGLTDTTWRSLYSYPDLTACLLHRPSIETRAMTFFVKAGMKKAFRDAFFAYFGDIYTLYTKEEVLSMELFGPGTPHPRTDGLIGDFLACAKDTVSIDPAMVFDPHPFRASHGGMTAAEMNIPLMICNNPLNQL